MKGFTNKAMLATTLVLFLATDAQAQIARTRTPGGEAPTVEAGMPRNPQFPYAGLWRGTRAMPVGDDDITFKFSVVDERYASATLHPGGGTEPHRQLVATAGGLVWEQPNSGGGTWVYHVRLAGPDSMIGTLVLRDAPPNLTPAPSGTMVLVRQTSAVRRQP